MVAHHNREVFMKSKILIFCFIASFLCFISSAPKNNLNQKSLKSKTNASIKRQKKKKKRRINKNKRKLAKMLEGLPGNLKLIEGGEVHLGLGVEEATRILKDKKISKFGLTKYILSFIGDQTEVLPPFLIGKTEVSNGEYEAFVKATGHRFPYHWWKKSDKRKHEKEFYQKNPTQRFDPIEYWETWWEYRKLQWEIPKHRKTKKPMVNYPVEWVSYLDALAYCRWAGTRLPTEAEWVRAARGNTRNPYPWGKKWDPKKVRIFKSTPVPVDYPMEGVSPFGILHMAGNVFEITCSRYKKFEGFEKVFRALERKGLTKGFYPPFDAGCIVVKGGSYWSADHAQLDCMIDTRGFADLDNAIKSVGFRVCKSLWPGLDAFRVAYQLELKQGLLGGAEVDLESENTTNYLGMEAYDLKEGNEISGYHSIGFAPIARHKRLSSGRDIKNASIEEPVPVGLLFTTEKLANPPLPPGFFLVYYRDKGQSKRILQKILERKRNKRKKTKEKGKKEKTEQEPEEELSTDYIKFGDVKIPTNDRYFLFRVAKTGKWLDKYIKAQSVMTGSSRIRSEMRIFKEREIMRFTTPIKLKRETSAAIFTIDIKLTKGTLSKKKWRLPFEKRPGVYGYQKGWERLVVQAWKEMQAEKKHNVLASSNSKN